MQSLPHLDRDGLITGRPLLLWRLALPLRVDFIDIAGRLIDEWVQHGLVIRYPGKEGPVLFFKGFRRHNAKIYYEEERPSIYPPPPGWLRTAVGLIPEDEEQRLLLAESFDVRSSYRKALLAPDGQVAAGTGRPLTRKRRESGYKLARNSPETDQEVADHWPEGGQALARHPPEADQELASQSEVQDQHGGGGDHSFTHIREMGGEGLGEGGAAHSLAATQAWQRLDFGEDVLRRAAVELGPLIFGSDFRGYGSYVAQADGNTLRGLLAWIGYFWERIERSDGIRELPAYIRSCVKRGDWPSLTGEEWQVLVGLIEQVQGA